MFIATKEFTFEDTLYKIGDTVPDSTQRMGDLKHVVLKTVPVDQTQEILVDQLLLDNTSNVSIEKDKKKDKKKKKK